MSPRRIPVHAERLFSLLCADADVTCNKSTEDEEGWDYLLQYPIAKPTSTHFDMILPGEICFVQIKSNSSKFRGARLKLSNAHRIAITPVPAFVVVLGYDKSKALQSIHVLHVWKNEIARILKRVRLETNKEKKDLNKIEIEFGLSSLIAADEGRLLQLIQSTIQNVGSDYSEQKRKFVASIGFDETPITGTIKLKQGDTIEDLIDAQVGIKDHLEGATVTVQSNRFGITAEPISLSGGRLTVRSHPKECTLHISSVIEGKEIALKSELYLPAVPHVDLNNLKFRIVNKFVEMASHGKDQDATINIHPDFSSALSLADLGNAVELTRLSSHGRLHIRATFEGRALFGFHVTLENFVLDRATRILSDFFEHLNIRNLNSESPDTFLSKDFLSEIDTIARVNILASSRTVDGSCEIAWVGAPYVGPAYCLFHTCIEVAHFSFYLIIQRKIELSAPIDGKTHVKINEVEYVIPHILRGNREETEPAIANEVSARANFPTDLPILVFSEKAFPVAP